MSDPAGALNVARNVCQNNPNVNVHTIAEIFM